MRKFWRRRVLVVRREMGDEELVGCFAGMEGHPVLVGVEEILARVEEAMLVHGTTTKDASLLSEIAGVREVRNQLASFVKEAGRRKE